MVLLTSEKIDSPPKTLMKALLEEEESDWRKPKKTNDRSASLLSIYSTGFFLLKNVDSSSLDTHLLHAMEIQKQRLYASSTSLIKKTPKIFAETKRKSREKEKERGDEDEGGDETE